MRISVMSCVAVLPRSPAFYNYFISTTKRWHLQYLSSLYWTTIDIFQIKDPLAILNKDEDVPDRYFLAPSITPRRYRVELAPSVESDKRVRIKGRVSIDFVQNGTESPSQVVLSVKHLNITSYRLVVVGGGAGDKETSNVTKTAGKVPAGGGSRRRKRQVEDPKNGEWRKSVEAGNTRYKLSFIFI